MEKNNEKIKSQNKFCMSLVLFVCLKIHCIISIFCTIAIIHIFLHIIGTKVDFKMSIYSDLLLHKKRKEEERNAQLTY